MDAREQPLWPSDCVEFLESDGAETVDDDDSSEGSDGGNSRASQSSTATVKDKTLKRKSSLNPTKSSSISSSSSSSSSGPAPPKKKQKRAPSKKKGTMMVNRRKGIEKSLTEKKAAAQTFASLGEEQEDTTNREEAMSAELERHKLGCSRAHMDLLSPVPKPLETRPEDNMRGEQICSAIDVDRWAIKHPLAVVLVRINTKSEDFPEGEVCLNAHNFDPNNREHWAHVKLSRKEIYDLLDTEVVDGKRAWVHPHMVQGQYALLTAGGNSYRCGLLMYRDRFPNKMTDNLLWPLCWIYYNLNDTLISFLGHKDNKVHDLVVKATWYDQIVHCRSIYWQAYKTSGSDLDYSTWARRLSAQTKIDYLLNLGKNVIENSTYRELKAQGMNMKKSNVETLGNLGWFLNIVAFPPDVFRYLKLVYESTKKSYDTAFNTKLTKMQDAGASNLPVYKPKEHLNQTFLKHLVRKLPSHQAKDILVSILNGSLDMKKVSVRAEQYRKGNDIVDWIRKVCFYLDTYLIIVELHILYSRKYPKM